MYKGHKASAYLKGGETAAFQVMEKFCKNTQKVAAFKKPMTNPTALKPDTTALSAYLKFGAMSSREFWWKVQDIYTATKGHHT